MKETETVAETTAGVAQTKYTHRARQLSRKERIQNEQNAHDKQVQCAFAAFYTYTLSCPEEINAQDQISQAVCRHQQKYTFSGETAKAAAKNLALIIRRNQVQDKIVAVSENVCRRFKIALNDQITKTNFSLGSTATALAGLGAIFTPADTARALSGASAIFSGIRAQYNDAYLQSLTVQVVTKGIDARRQEILDEINGKRYGPPFLESAQEVEYFDELLIPVDFVCLTDDGIERDCEPSEMRDRIKLAALQKELLEAANSGARGDVNRRKAVRYASRPYIPLSPYDKVTLALQEEFERELLDKKKEVRKLNNDVAKIDGEIEKINADNQATVRNAQQQRITQAADLQEEIDKKEQDILTNVSQSNAIKKQLNELKERLKGQFMKSPGERKRIADLEEQVTDLDAKVGALRADVKALKVQSGALREVAQAANVNNCGAKEHENKAVCRTLKNNIADLGGVCGSAVTPQADAAKCKAFAELSPNERMQCVPKSDLSQEKRNHCVAAGLYAQGDGQPIIASKAIKDCKSDFFKDETVCEDLAGAVKKLTDMCPPADADADTDANGELAKKCAKFAKLKDDDAFKCLPKSNLDADKREACKAIGLMPSDADAMTKARPIKTCAAADAAEKACKDLTAELTRLGGRCAMPPKDNLAAAQCDAFRKLSAAERLQCVTGGNLPNEKEVACQTADLLEVSRAAGLAAGGASNARSEELKELQTRKEAKKVEITRLNERISILEDRFGGELAKVDAIVGMVPISQYTVELAVADAMRYHAACTIPAGLEQAADSVEKIRTPGFDTVSQGLDNMINLQRKMNTLEDLRKESTDRDEEDDEEAAMSSRNGDVR